MANIKITAHTTYTYETTDGREFEDIKEAERWQKHLQVMRHVTMLDNKFKRTSEHDEACYVYVKNNEQVEAFDALRCYQGMCAYIPYPGYWYYDERTDTYVDIVKERDKLQSMIESLDVLGK